jgi:hypothetical protein
MSLFAEHNSSTAKDDHRERTTGTQPNYSGLNACSVTFDDQSHFAARINNLIAEHDDLDQAVASMLRTIGCDDLAISRLKKRKLHLKDEISYARNRLRGLTESVA